MNYYSRKSLSKYFMYTIDFNKHNIDIFINDTWQKYAGDPSKLQGGLNFAFDQQESKVDLHKVNSLPESHSNVSPAIMVQIRII
jgi:hypothetical protein